MRVAVIGRTGTLLRAAQSLVAAGHSIGIVWTFAGEAHYDCGEEAFREFARENKAEFAADLGINSVAGLERIRSAGCAVAISMNCPIRLTNAIMGAFEHGILNAHAGDLPRYRGNACPNWAILAGEQHVGLCIHEMTIELDAGPVLARDRFPLSPETYIGDVYNWLDRRVPEMMTIAVSGLEDGSLVAVPQDSSPKLTLRSYPRRPDDARIDWSWPVASVIRMVRASSRPFSGAFCHLEGQAKVTIWRAAEVDHPGAFLAVPGQVCFALDGDPVVACGDDLVRLSDVEVDGFSGSVRGKQQILKSLRNRLT